MVNEVKNVIQKEEFIALAINKYILQTATIPKKNDNTLDWEKLKNNEYLGSNFNITNPITSKDMVVVFNSKNSAYIEGIIEKEGKNKYDTQNNYLYNFYVNKLFRVNTIPSENITKDKLLIGSQVLYSDIQREIVSLINENNNDKKIKLASQECESNRYYYELKNGKLTYKYCKGATSSVEVFQESPVYLEDWEDLQYIKANIGDKAYVKKNGTWYEYYYQGDLAVKWIASGMGDALTSIDENLDIEDRILSYIPDSKDLIFRRDGGCMLANGDIFCWGNNLYKKAGIESSGQLDRTLKPAYVNTPIMLKVQIENKDQAKLNWYNNPYRVKFEKMSMNSTNVCGVSPLFDYFDGVQKKFGGDLYCNGQISELFYENITSGVSESSILSKNRFFAWGKDDETDDAAKEIPISQDGGPVEKDQNKNELIITRDEIYLKDIVMVEDTVAVLSDSGKIYTFGRNYKGTLGIGDSDKFIVQQTPKEVKNSGQVFKKIFALRDMDTFGAIDDKNLFYIWGEREGTTYNEPTLLNDSIQFNPDGIFTNSKEFILKGVNNVFYRTTGNKEFRAITQIPSTAVSASMYDKNSVEKYLFIDEDLVLKGSNDFLLCKNKSGNNCTSNSKNIIFDTALTELNAPLNKVNGNSYANFANISIYQLDTVKAEKFENFEDGKSDGWSGSSNNYTTSKPVPITKINDNGDKTRIAPTSFLGRFSMGNGTGLDAPPSHVEKTFSFGSVYANDEVELEFDFYEIDTWDYEKFTVILNNVAFVEDSFVHDKHPVFIDDNDTGQYLQPVGASGSVYTDGDQTFHYKIKTKLDQSGNLTVRFRTRGLNKSDEDYYDNAVAQGLSDESWGIDNVHIKVKETSKTFVCAMTGLGSASQMYCWGDVGRAIPILSTSLYDISKINTLNELFISEERNKNKQMSFNNYDNSGNLFLRYPTYIGGFDYPFYFK